MKYVKINKLENDDNKKEITWDDVSAWLNALNKFDLEIIIEYMIKIKNKK